MKYQFASAVALAALASSVSLPHFQPTLSPQTKRESPQN